MLPRALASCAPRPLAPGAGRFAPMAGMVARGACRPLPRASVRPRCSASPKPFSSPTHDSQARGLHVTGDVSMGVGRLNEQAPTTASATPSATASTTASTSLAAATQVPVPASNTSRAAVAASAADLGGTSLVPAAGAVTPSATPAPGLTRAPYSCIAVLEPPRPTCCKHLAVSAGGRHVAASHAEYIEDETEYQLVYCERWDLSQSSVCGPKALQQIGRRGKKHWAFYPLIISECGQRVLTMGMRQDMLPAVFKLYVCDESERGKAVSNRVGCGNGCRILNVGWAPGDSSEEAAVGGRETSAEEGHKEEEKQEADVGDEDEWAWVIGMALSASGRYAAAAMRSTSSSAIPCTWLSVWDLDPAEPRSRRSSSPLATIRLDVPAMSMVISPDGSCVTAITRCIENNTPHRVWRWQVGSGKLSGPVQLQGDVGSLDESAISSDGRTAVAFKDSQVQVWDLTTGALTATFKGRGGTAVTAGTQSSSAADVFTCAAISADGHRAASGSKGGAVNVWDLKTMTCLATLKGHGVGVTAVAISPDGNHVVSGGESGAVRVWQLME